MKYLRTYEGLFDFLKKKKIEPVPEISVKQQCSDITDEIVDSMWDIFDKYEINDSSSLDKWQSSSPSGLHWNYNYTQLNDGSTVKCGIRISGWKNYIGTDIRSLVDDKFEQPLGNEFLNDMREIIPVINARTGIVLNRPHIGGPFTAGYPADMGSNYIIDFAPYISSNIRRRGW